MGKDEASEKAKAAAEAEKLAQENADEANEEEDDGTVVQLSGEEHQATPRQGTAYEMNLEMARELSRQDPKIVANVIKKWVNNE